MEKSGKKGKNDRNSGIKSIDPFSGTGSIDLVVTYPPYYILKEWEEVTGILESIEEKNEHYLLSISGKKLRILAEQKNINRNIIGKRVSILRTDSQENPIIFRILSDKLSEG